MTETTPARLTLLYDDECPLCRRFKEAIESWDAEGVIDIVDLATAESQPRFRYVNFAAARQQLTVCDQLGNASHGIEALRRLTQLLPGIRRLTWVYRLPGVTPAIGKVYQDVNRRRQRLCLKCGEKWMPSLKSSRRNRKR